MTSLVKLPENTQLIILHMLTYQDILHLMEAYSLKEDSPKKIILFRRLLRHTLVLNRSHQRKYLFKPLNRALPFQQLSLEMQYCLHNKKFKNPQRDLRFLCISGRDEEKKHYIQNYLYFNSKNENPNIKNQWLKYILESEFELHTHPEILTTLAFLYRKNNTTLNWDTFHHIQFKNLSTKTLFFLHLIRNFHDFTHRERLILQFVNSEIDFEYKRLFFNMGLDVHLYSAAKAHVRAFLGPQSLLSAKEQRTLIQDALRKPVLNLAFLIFLKDHPFYPSLLPNETLEKHYAWIEQMEISERFIFNSPNEFYISIDYQKYEEPEVTGDTVSSLHGFIILNTFMSFYQNNHWPESVFGPFRNNMITQFTNHSHPVINQYLKHVLHELASDIKVNSEIIIQQIQIKNDPYSDLHAYLFLKLHLRQFNRMLNWHDIIEYSTILFKIYSSKKNDKYLTWWINNLNERLFFFEPKPLDSTFPLKIRSLKILIDFCGIQMNYLNEIIKNLNYIENKHQSSRIIRSDDYYYLCQLFRIQYKPIKREPHQLIMNKLIEKLVTHRIFQLEKTQIMEIFYLNLLNSEYILIPLKIHLIFTLFMHTYKKMQHHLLEHLARIYQQWPQTVHQLYSQQHFIKIHMAHFYLNMASPIHEMKQLELILFLLQDNSLIQELSPIALTTLRNTFINMILQSQAIDLALNIGDIILKKSPYERIHQGEFLFHRLMSPPFLPFNQQAKIIEYLMNRGLKIFQIQTYQPVAVVLGQR